MRPRFPKRFLASYIPFKGGLDTVSPPFEITTGKVTRSQNWYQSLKGGYQTYQGHERYDGQAKPSNAIYSILTVTLTATVSAGDIVTDTGTANGTVIAATSTSLVLTKVTGTFTAGTIYVAAADIGTCDGAQAVNAAATQLLSAQYKNLAADQYRADITTVPGSGSILGVTALNDIVYSFRNNAAGTAAAMYASSSSGWTLCDLGETIFFNAGTAEPLVDETLTGGTSAATGTIKKVIVTSGSWSGTDAAGRIILYSVAGDFVSGETITSASGSATSTSVNTANTLQPSGTFKTIIFNFTGSTDTVRVYGCDGASNGFEWDGAIFVPIITGMTVDAPSEVYAHRNQLFFSFRGSVQNSSPGSSYDWSPITGASEIAMGDTVTGFLEQPGDTPTLAIFTDNETAMLYGSGVADWKLVPYKQGPGARSRSMQRIGHTFMLGNQGVIKLSTSQMYGNFLDATVSQDVHSWIVNKIGSFTCSCTSNDQNLYCLFFEDKTALFVTIDNGEAVAFMPLLFPQIVKCCHSYEDSNGNEIIIFGDENGYVYQMFKGTSFDGAAIVSYIYLSYNNFKTPQIKKRYRRIAFEVNGDGFFDFDFNYTVSYGSSTIAQPVAQNETLSVAPLFFDSGLTFDSGLFFNTTSLTPIEFSMGAIGMNVSLQISTNSDYCSSLLFSGAMVQYTYAQEIRR